MTRSASDVLGQEFLQVRAKLLEVAAFFDRLDEARNDDSAADQLDRRQLELLARGSGILTDGEPNKAARLQLLFSREYQSDWRETFEI